MDLLVRLVEELERRAGAGPESAILVSTAVRMMINTFAAWERDAESGRRTISAGDPGSIMVDSTLGLLGPPGISSAGR
jgi:hypothetical protein